MDFFQLLKRYGLQQILVNPQRYRAPGIVKFGKTGKDDINNLRVQPLYPFNQI